MDELYVLPGARFLDPNLIQKTWQPYDVRTYCTYSTVSCILCAATPKECRLKQ
jgi:hypothetical protein